MKYLNGLLAIVGNVFRYHKLKIAFFLGSILFFLVIMFPYSDLSDFASSKISEMTFNQVNVQFDSIGFGLMPQIGVKMHNVTVDAAMGTMRLSGVKAESVAVAPNILKSIINQIKGKIKLADAIAMVSKASLVGIFGGDLDVHISESNKLGPEAPAVRLQIDASTLDLKDISQFVKTNFNLPINGKGTLSLDADILVDPIFKVDPNGKYELSGKSINIPDTEIPLNMNGAIMPMQLPGMKFDQLKVRGKLEDKRLVIEDGKFGEPKDDLYGEIKGDLDLNLRPGGMISTGGFNFVVELVIKEQKIAALGAMWSIAEGYLKLATFKNKTNDGFRYSFRIEDAVPSQNNNFLPFKLSAPR